MQNHVSVSWEIWAACYSCTRGLVILACRLPQRRHARESVVGVKMDMSQRRTFDNQSNSLCTKGESCLAEYIRVEIAAGQSPSR